MKILTNIVKHLFIPHEHNDYKPHFFRETSIGIILVVVTILLSFSTISKLVVKSKDMIGAVLPAVLVDLTNNDRTTNGEQILTRNESLDKAAQLKANDMAGSQYFAHTSPTGITPWYWINKVGYTFIYAGENLAIDFTESVDVENAWLNSPKHKENIMNEHFTEIGIATAEGYYNGSPTTYVVQMFGAPAFASIPKTEIKPTVTEATPKTIKEKPAPTKVAVAPEVKGEESTLGLNLKTITDTKDFISVKNLEATPIEEKIETKTSTVVPEVKTETLKYSTWKERLMFMLPGYTNNFYKIFVFVVLIALILMMVIEIRRQHPKNIMYGVLIIVIIICFIYINKTMFINSLLV